MSANSVKGPSLSVIRIILAPRVLHSLILDSIRFNFESEGTTAITGEPSVKSAMGPCFNSPPGNDKHGMYEISIIFNAPSLAMYEDRPPRPMKIGGLELRISFVACFIESSKSIIWLDTVLGIFLSSCTISFFSLSGMFEIVREKRSPAATILENTFVEATANSGPACRYAPFPVNLAIVDPITLHNELTWLPNFFASKRASRVSFVSPDWDTPMVSVLGEQTYVAGNSLAMNASERTDVNFRMYEEMISEA